MSTFTLSKSERTALQSQSPVFQICSLPATKNRSAQSLAVPDGSGQAGGSLKQTCFWVSRGGSCSDCDLPIPESCWITEAQVSGTAKFEPQITYLMFVSPSGNWRSRCNNRSLHHPDFVFGEPLWGCINTRQERLV